MNPTDHVPMLRGERIWLRPIERRDLEAYRLACTDGETGLLSGFLYPASEATVERWFQQVELSYGKEGFWFTICALGDDAFRGTAWLKNLDLVHGSAEFSIFVSDKSWWGRGYGTEVLDTTVDFGFGTLPLERIYLYVESRNERAIASYRKSGFVTEGILRHDRRILGRFGDSIVMSMLRGEWESLSRPKIWDRASEPHFEGTSEVARK